MTKGYLINLERRPDRLLRFNSEPFVIDFDIEVVPAVDGQEVVVDHSRIEQHFFRKLSEEKTKRVYACCLSHIKVLEKIYSDYLSTNDNTPVVVFEDDCILMVDYTDFKRAWKDLVINDNINFVWLGSSNLYPKKLQIGSYRESSIKVLQSSTDFTAESYMIRPSYAKVLYDSMVNNIGSSDGIMLQFLEKNFQNYCLNFPLFCQRDRSDTDIQKY